MSQLLLIPDPRPLVERLGVDFFHAAPGSPGVYLMRDASKAVLYVGKARNLRKRLCSYRVANPDRMRKRHLRLLRQVASIDLEICSSDEAALKREADLIVSLKPRFNRAGTWQGPGRFLAWRVEASALKLSILTAPQTAHRNSGPLGASAAYLRAAIARLLWCSFNPVPGAAALPAGWFAGRHGEEVRIEAPSPKDAEHAALLIDQLMCGVSDDFEKWVRQRCGTEGGAFDENARQTDLEYLRTATEGLKRRLAGGNAAPVL
jgi:predicted GIY-YIG superfamily endonuclease